MGLQTSFGNGRSSAREISVIYIEKAFNKLKKKEENYTHN
jgi:hypothetical protein